MAHPLATKAIGAGRVKNDAVDAATLAHLLRTNLLPEAWIAPPEVRELRRLVRMRASLVRVRSRLKCQVHAICADAGVSVPASDLRQAREGLERGVDIEVDPVDGLPGFIEQHPAGGDGFEHVLVERAVPLTTLDQRLLGVAPPRDVDDQALDAQFPDVRVPDGARMDGQPRRRSIAPVDLVLEVGYRAGRAHALDELHSAGRVDPGRARVADRRHQHLLGRVVPEHASASEVDRKRPSAGGGAEDPLDGAFEQIAILLLVPGPGVFGAPVRAVVEAASGSLSCR